MARVLCTGIDSLLQETRKMVLEHDGHTVAIAMTEEEIRAACLRSFFDVAIIGQVTLPGMKHSTFHTIREYSPGTRILELHDVNRQPELKGADDWLEVPSDVPEDLLMHVARLAGLGGRSP